MCYTVERKFWNDMRESKWWQNFHFHFYPFKMYFCCSFDPAWSLVPVFIEITCYSNDYSSWTGQLFLSAQRITSSESITYGSKIPCHLFQLFASIRHNNGWLWVCVCVLYIRVFCVCRLVYVHQMLQQRTLSKTPLVTKGPDTLWKTFC